MERVSFNRLSSLLVTFGLKHSSKILADIIERAERDEQTHREFLLAVLETEAKGRNERRRHRNYAGAHFPPVVKSLEEFDPSELESGITESQLHHLKELGWLDSYGNVVLAGPPGLGKTMIAVGLGLHAVNEGYTVCFEKMANLIRILDESGVERSVSVKYICTLYCLIHIRIRILYFW